MTPIQSPEVAAKFDAYPLAARRALLALREMIFETAKTTPAIGELQETLKWGEPAYMTSSTVRIGWKARAPERYAMYFHCQTTLAETFRTLFPNDFEYQGNRALVFKLGDHVPTDALAFCVAAALTYHLSKPQSRRAVKANTA